MKKRVTSSGAKQKKSQDSVTLLLLKEAYAIIVKIYLLSVLVIMPLYIYDHYYEMALSKWKVYLFATLGFGGVVLAGSMLYLVSARGKIRSIVKESSIGKRFDLTYILAILYAISVVIGMLCSGYAKAAWLGTDSWYMGVLAQLLFVGTFLLFVCFGAPAKAVIGLNLVTSFVCYVIGIAQRYGWDFLHLYYGMEPEVIRDYLSTIGNRTWYSGYISVVFPIGVYLFWRGGTDKVKWLTGIYTFFAFSAIVTNNSDSIYLAVMAVILGLFIMSLGNIKKLYRWICVWVIWFVACCTMSVMRMLFPTYIRQLRGLSKLCLDIRFAIAGTVIAFIMLIVLWYLTERKGFIKELAPKKIKKLQLQCLVFVLSVFCMIIAFVIANSTGLIEKLFGFTVDSNYLLFSDSWGDDRGFNWKFTLHMFGELEPMQKLFGVGSDCYALHAYSNPGYVEELTIYFGQYMVANSHNEWLNSLLCNGLIGSVLYLGLFISVMIKCFVNSDSEHMHPFVPMIGLCVLGYITHNMFCYQQICATGPIFILMGIAMHSMRTGGKGNYGL